MSTFKNSHISTNQSIFVNYNLINMPLYASDVKTKSSFDGNYQISYNANCTTNSNNYNITYQNPKDSNHIHHYCATEIYFYKLYHDNIENITDKNGDKDIIGEIIIETSDIEKGDKFYLCFFVKSVLNGGTDDTKSKSGGSISKIYNNIILDSKGNFNYNSTGTSSATGGVTVSPSGDGTIPPQNLTGCIIYYDTYSVKDASNNAYVMLNLNPITVSNKDVISFFNSLSPNTTPPFHKYPSKGEPDILTASLSSVISNTIGLSAIKNNPAIAKLLGTASALDTTSSSSSDGKDGQQIDNDIYIDCSPTGVSEEEIATYKVPISSAYTNDAQNASFMQLCGNFAVFALLLLVAYIAIPGLFSILIKNANGAEHYYIQFTFVFYFCILFIGLLAEGFKNGNMIEITAGIMMVVLAVLSYVLTTYQLMGMKNISITDFNVQDFGFFLIQLIIYLITKSYILILVGWITLVVTLVILVFVKDYDKQKALDVGLWVGLAGIPVVSGIFMYVSGV